MFAPLLRYFVEVVHTGSIRSASEKLHIAASAINRHIIEFEEQIGTPLFERLPRGMRLTEAGTVLYESAKRLQYEYQSALEAIDSLRQANKGHVTIAMLQGFADEALPAIVISLLHDYPGISYSIVVRSSPQCAELVAEGEADLALCYDPSEALRLNVVRSIELAMGVVSLPGHPIALLPQVNLADALRFPLLLPRTGEMRYRIDRMLAALGGPVAAMVETDSMGMFRKLVLSGAGVGIVTRAAIWREVTGGELAFSPLAPDARSRLCLIHKGGRTLPMAVHVVLKRFLERFPFDALSQSA